MNNEYLNWDWVSVYVDQPEHGEIVSSMLYGREGYCSETIWDATDNTFKTYEQKENRFIITIWKHDLWCRKNRCGEDGK